MPVIYALLLEDKNAYDVLKVCLDVIYIFGICLNPIMPTLSCRILELIGRHNELIEFGLLEKPYDILHVTKPEMFLKRLDV